METLIDSIIDFVRVRQLNIALAGVLTLIYLVYQYWGLLFKGQEDDDDDCRHSTRLSRSRSRTGHIDANMGQAAPLERERLQRETFNCTPARPSDHANVSFHKLTHADLLNERHIEGWYT